MLQGYKTRTACFRIPHSWKVWSGKLRSERYVFFTSLFLKVYVDVFSFFFYVRSGYFFLTASFSLLSVLIKLKRRDPGRRLAL